ncbi:MAG: ATP-dependent DNA helicase [Acidimicrobiia bacterium]
MNDEVRIAPDEWDKVLDDSDGHQIIVAGPGTGKTEFLVRRVAHLVGSGRATREQILVLTFSRRAARSIGDRINHGLGGSTVPVEATTFHSLALRILESATDGIRPTPLTTPEQVATVRALLSSEDTGNWPLTYRGVLTTSGFAEEVADFLMRCSERLLTPEDLEQRAAERADWRGIPGFYRRYLDHLDDSGRVDYGTLLVKAVHALESGVAGSVSSHYTHVLVDEFQDTSPAQALLAELLSRHTGNLTVTGDPYQSIYSFRGAELRNIVDFEQGQNSVKRIILDGSFRVPEAIMSAALRVVSAGQLPGSAGPVKPATHPGRVEAYIFDQETAEAEWIAGEIDRAIHVDGTEPSDLAILVRSKQEMFNELSRALTRRGIPHERPDRRLIDHPAIQLIADLVTLTYGDIDPTSENASPLEVEAADTAARRVILGPLFGLSLGQQRTLRAERRRGGTWQQVFEHEDGFGDISRLLADPSWATALPATDGFWKVWTSLDRFAVVVSDPDRQTWRKAYSSFSQVLERQADRDPEMSLADFFALSDDESFEATPLLTYSSSMPAVVLTTLHQAKGLEFEQVFIANAVEGVFPDLRRSRRMLRPELLSPERTTDPSAVSAFQVQEEMRIAYTAMTRSRSRVVWTATDAGVDQGERRPSRFLLAASGEKTLDDIGAPGIEDLDPISVAEAEVALRRIVGDPGEVTASRTAAITVLARPPRPAWDARYFPGVKPKGPDRPILAERFSMSPSQADSYSRCPRKYAIERRLKLPEPPSSYMTSGSLIHLALELAESKVIGTGLRHGDPEDAVSFLREGWDAGEFGTPALNRAWLNRAEGIVRGLYERWPETSMPPIELEKEVELEIGGVKWYGVVDRLERSDAGLRVIDYKTGTTIPSLKEAAVSVQLGFYALAINAMSPGENVVAAELWFPAKESKGLTVRELDMNRLGEVEESIREITADVASENWEPRVSRDCERCGIKSSCPAWPEGRGAYLP